MKDNKIRLVKKWAGLLLPNIFPKAEVPWERCRSSNVPHPWWRLDCRGNMRDCYRCLCDEDAFSDNHVLSTLLFYLIDYFAVQNERCPGYTTRRWVYPLHPDCQTLFKRLSVLKKNIIMQWIPSHCGILGNEKADGLAKSNWNFADINGRNAILHCSLHDSSNYL